MVNKKTIILLGILTLLVFIMLNRWDVRYYHDGRFQVKMDKLAAQTEIVILDNKYYQKETFTNQYLVHGATFILYGSMVAVTIALLKEARKE